MKLHLTICTTLLSLVSVGQVVSQVMQMPQQPNPIRVTLNYDRPIGGYIATAIWQPFESKNCETGRIVVTFRHVDTGAEFQYVNTEKFSSYHTDSITFAEGFEGYKDGDCFMIEYTSPEASRYPLDRYLPFQFFDVDFDGVEELLVLDWGGSRYGDFSVYEITNEGLEEKSYPPFNQFCCYTQFDPNHQIIQNFWEDGCWVCVEVTCEKRSYKRPQTIAIPVEFEQTLKDLLADVSTTPTTDFQIKAAQIRIGDREHCLEVRNGRWYYK